MELIAGAPGYGPPESKCLCWSGVSRTIVGVLPRAAFVDHHRSNSQVSVGSLRHSSNGVTLCCKSNSGASRRNSDFPRHNKHGFPRGRNQPMEERQSYNILDESDSFPSKNGTIPSISSSPKPQATAVPGPREKEIVELFRKVQAQLRERAAMREEKKTQESTKERGTENETVDSLLKLLRKHSVEQSKRKHTSRTVRNLGTEQTEQPVASSHEEGGLSFFDSDSSSRRDTARVPNSSTSHSRPISNFRRRSPIPRVKYPAINLETERSRSLHPEPEDEHEFKPETGPDDELEEHEAVPEERMISGEATYNHMSDSDDLETDESESIETGEEQDQFGAEDLTRLKLVELRALAKSRRIKGFSKMKKNELLQLLSRNSV